MSLKYWNADDSKLIDSKEIQASLLQFKCCEKHCLRKNFEDDESLFDLKKCIKFVYECRREYCSKSEQQRDDLVYNIFGKCLSSSTNKSNTSSSNRFLKINLINN